MARRLATVVDYLRYLVAPRSILRAYLPGSPHLSHRELALLVRDRWYHDFSVLGVPTPQEDGIYGPNQESKQGLLFEFIDDAVALARASRPHISGVELFCADGFYSNYALTRGVTEILGVDLDEDALSKARLISKVLGHSDRARFERSDVFSLRGQYDIGICAGGLYHLTDPASLLRQLTMNIRTVLVIQTVFSLANTSEDYFESPAPGWTWGCRFSHARLLKIIKSTGWRIMKAATNELLGNRRLDDRGSAYLLCMPAFDTRQSAEPRSDR